MTSVRPSLGVAHRVLDPAADAVLADPDQVYGELRRSRGPVRLPDGTLVVYTHHGVRAALRDSATFSCADTNAARSRRVPVLVGTDPPDHSRLRQAAMRAFSSTARAEWQESVGERTRATVDRALRSQRFDAVARLCSAVPVAALAELMRVPAARLAYLAIQPPTGAGGDRRRLLATFFESEVRARRQAPGSDLISSLIDGAGEVMTDQEAIAHCALLLSAGIDAPRDLLANILIHLAAHPADLDRVRAEPAFADAVVEEAMRYFSPVQAVYRTLRRDVHLDAATGRGGERALLVLASANRDAEVWDEPDSFRADRYLAPRRDAAHLGLGAGAHACIGAVLARLTVSTALLALARSQKRLRLVRAPVRGRTIMFRRVARLDVAVEA